jgi:hypothetical protein
MIFDFYCVIARRAIFARRSNLLASWETAHLHSPAPASAAGVQQVQVSSGFDMAY